MVGRGRHKSVVLQGVVQVGSISFEEIKTDCLSQQRLISHGVLDALHTQRRQRQQVPAATHVMQIVSEQQHQQVNIRLCLL
jgi:hypothetical protein